METPKSPPGRHAGLSREFITVIRNPRRQVQFLVSRYLPTRAAGSRAWPATGLLLLQRADQPLKV